MEIKLLSSDKVYWQETWEHEFEINGEKHQFRVWDTPDERQFWFDDEEFWNEEDEVIEGLTIEDLLSWV